MLKENVKESVKRLEDMKQATILRYLSKINLEKNYYLYDEMMVRFARGEIDDYFSSSILDNLDEDYKEDVCKLANDYRSLCFYAGEGEYWGDSVDDVPTDDYELIALKIFDNYDFLLEMARDGGGEVLDQITKFQKCVGYQESSTIEVLRNSFGDDQLLKSVLLEMSREESLYEVFTDVQKAELCRLPEGTIFTYEGGEANLRNPLELAVALKSFYDEVEEEEKDNDNISDDLFSQLKESLAKLPVELVISHASDDYVREHGHYSENEKSHQKGKSMR